MTINKRLKVSREIRGFRSATEFAKYANVEIGTYRHHENGTRGLTIHAVNKYAHILDVPICWLMTGENDSVVKNQEEKNSCDSVLPEGDATSVIINKFMNLSEQDKKRTLKILASFTHKE